MYCSSCAKQIDSSEKFCKYCGAEQKLLDGTEKNTNKSKNTSQLVDVYLNENFIQSKSFSDLIEKNQSYYAEVFMRIQPIAEYLIKTDQTKLKERLTPEFQAESKKIGMQQLKLSGFNWGAFLGGPAWYAYRGMNVKAAYFLIIILIIDFIGMLFKPQYVNWSGVSMQAGGNSFLNTSASFVWVTVWVVMAFAANTAYFVHVNKFLKNSSDNGDIKNSPGVNLSKMIGVGIVMLVWEISINIVN